jgi:hypothetical protein
MILINKYPLKLQLNIHTIKDCKLLVLLIIFLNHNQLNTVIHIKNMQVVLHNKIKVRKNKIMEIIFSSTKKVSLFYNLRLNINL